MKINNILINILGLSTLLACTPLNHYEYVEGKINVVTTTTMLGDLATVIGGEFVSVFTIMKPGVNPHSYNPKPSDTRALAKADLVALNGLHLEAKMGEVLLSIEETKRYTASDTLENMGSSRILETNSGQKDPHVWGDVTNWMAIADSFKQKLIVLDPTNSDEYEANYNLYQQDLADLYVYALDRVNELDEAKRVLITAHDAFSYFGHLFNFEVYSIQGISTQSEASVKDIQDLANLVVDLGVKAIFVETSVPENTIRSVLEAVSAQGHEVKIGGHLYSDSLGDVASGEETYIKMYKHNVDAIVDALI